MSNKRLFTLILLFTLNSFALETIGHINKIIQDDEGIKIYLTSVFENSKPNSVFYLKNTHPNFDKISNVLQNNVNSNKTIVLKFQKNPIQLIENAQEFKK